MLAMPSHIRPALQALPIFLDRLADPITAVLLSITVVLIFGGALLQIPHTQH